MADVLRAPSHVILFVFCCCFVCNLFFYIMLLLPSLMTENNSWTSAQRLLTTSWKKLFPLASPTWRIYCFYRNRPKSPSFAWREEGHEGDRGQAAIWEFVGERVNPHCHLSYWSTCNHWKIKSMTYEPNLTLKTYVSPSRGWTTTWRTYSWRVLHCIGRIEQ